MKINMSCVLKYLKHDYKEEGTIIGLIALCAIVFAIVWFICTTGPSVIWPYISPYCTAYNILNGVVGVIVVVFTVGTAIFCNKESFLVEEISRYDGNVTTTDAGSLLIILIAFIFAVLPYLVYTLLYMISSKWESPVLSIIIFSILILIGTPIGCAIARCKEE
jgi:hypothetical protein